jgi:hypothetical protein
MDEFARREDGSESMLLADTRFDNHNKMTITGIVVAGTDAPDQNPIEDADRIMPRSHHYPTGYIGGGVFPVDIRSGDKVYFHYLCAENRTSMERNADGSWDIYMQVSDIFLMERDGRIIMNQNWVLGEEVKEPIIQVFDSLGGPVAQQLSPSKGIEIVKGFNMPSYVDEAVIFHIDPCRYRGVAREVGTGHRVYLSKDAAFPNVINNKKYELFRHTDILAIYHDDPKQVIPVGETHLVKVELNEYKSATISHTVITRAPEWGVIVASGDACSHGAPGATIMFTRRWTRPLTKEYYLISDSEILAHLQ